MRLLLFAGLVALVCVAIASTGGVVHRDAVKQPRIAKKLLGDADSARFGPTSQNEHSNATQDGDGPYPAAPPTDGVPSSVTAGDEAFKERALPGTDIPVDWTLNAISAWDAMTSSFAKQPAKNNGQDQVWDNIGPDQAKYPAVLNRTQHEYWDSGRVTSEAISPTCDPNYCRLWVAAAGGGIWRADNALSPNPKWVWVSGSFDSQSIGVLRQDPNDPSGNTIYAGTGEPNSAVDNEAGVGIYKTTDGGDTWTLVPGSRAVASGRAIGDIRVDPTNPAHYFVGTVRGIRGYTSVCCNGVVSRTPGAAPSGLYETTDGGATFNEVWDPNTQDIRTGSGNNKSESRGVSRIEFDPNDPQTIYISAFSRGMWRFSPRLDGSTGGNTPLGRQAGFKQIWQPGYNSTSHRTMFDLTSVAGKTRIYMTEGATGPFQVRPDPTKNDTIVIGFSSFWRTDAADQPAASLLATETIGALQGCQTSGAQTGWQNFGCRFRGTPGRTVYNFCTGQCWYDQDVYTPKGSPDTVYVIGSYQYNEIYNISNSRSILLSTNAGDPDPAIKGGDFSDESWDSTPDKTPDGVHPDQHAILTMPGNPLAFFEGSDGGMITNQDSKYVDESYLCDSRPVDPAGQVNCRQLLSRVPLQLYDTLNKGLDTLQFNSLSINPKRPLDNVQGGTQDNGTFEWNSSVHVWPQIMYGDGGQSGYDSTDDTIRFNEFTGAATDTNFHSGDPQWWVVTSGPLQPPQNGGEALNFYSAIVQDPTLHGQRFVGESHLWRTQDNGGPEGYLEANCPEFTTSFDDPRCGDYVPLGGPKGPGQQGDLASGAMYGADKTLGPGAGTVSTLARCRGDNSTAWVGTDGGRVFISRNISDPNASAVQFTRIDNKAPNSPARFVSGIWVNTANCNEAWISYSGYDANAASPPGHVFHVIVDPTNNVTLWQDLRTEAATANQQASPALDLPITDVVRDDVTGDLYAGTDFGVLKDPGGVVGGWVPFDNGLPRVQISGLTIIPEARVMYAATHGRGGYRMILSGKKTSNNPPGQGTP